MCGLCGRLFEDGDKVHTPGDVLDDEMVCDWCMDHAADAVGYPFYAVMS